MEEKETCIGKHFKLTMMSQYKKWKQYIVGITVNKEHQYFASNSLYEDIELKRAKYEFNIWLFLISFHLTIYGKTKRNNL